VQLEAAGYTTVLQAWDFRPGSAFLHEMQQATSSAGRTIAVLSPAYFGSRFSGAEWRAVFAKDPTGERGLLVPVRVQECQPPGLLASRVYIDLVEVGEEEARRRLLSGWISRVPADLRPVPRRRRGREAVSWAGPGGQQLAGTQPELLRARRTAGAAACLPAGGVGGSGGAKGGAPWAWRGR
jgi:TIR domain